jgi:hypothetical protein
MESDIGWATFYVTLSKTYLVALVSNVPNYELTSKSF